MKREIRVVGAIFEKNRRIFLARRGPGTYLAEFWEFPGGKVEEGESPKHALARELMEELGISAEVGDLFGRHRHEYPEFIVELEVYRIERYEGEMNPVEHDEIGWFTGERVSSLQIAPADIPLLEMLLSDR